MLFCKYKRKHFGLTRNHTETVHNQCENLSYIHIQLLDISHTCLQRINSCKLRKLKTENGTLARSESESEGGEDTQRSARGRSGAAGWGRRTGDRMQNDSD